uniref:OPA3-domain-containing protein n=1 Tax=Ganoderma boninense TaxID=34458 RepID=A0A5K1K617_9APHY|nr:Eukaryotic translation initiation factor 3 subunit G (eIF3g) (Eukaryotic translation initiation factor 3 RNA-binding subunit) (eIF-3 RNA-binding subunit) (Translation initiation factor eIF3 p33 subunit homolog) (eIF3 p33 homolog) [Ganoderma boninense]
MATAKIASLVIRTLAKPISNQLKVQAKQHERFRSICIGLAQRMYQTEVRLRTNLLGEPAKHVRPLSETRAIENGANTLAEGFLFAVAAGLILGEQYRSSRNQSKRRDTVDDQLDELKSSVEGLNTRLDALARQQEERLAEESMRYVLHFSYVPIYAPASCSNSIDMWTLRHDELARILQRVVEIGLRGGWAEFEGTPLPLPRIDITQRPPASPSASPSSSGSQIPRLPRRLSQHLTT